MYFSFVEVQLREKFLQEFKFITINPYCDNGVVETFA